MRDTRICCDHCHNDCNLDNYGHIYMYVTFLEKSVDKLDVSEHHYCAKCYKELIEDSKVAHPEAGLEL